MSGTQTISSYTQSNFTVPLGTRSVALTVTWSQGPMPTDSTGANVASLRCPNSYSRSVAKSIEGVYVIKIGNSTNGFDDHGLVSHSANNIYVSQSYGESGTVLRHRFALPSDMLTGRTLWIWQYNSSTQHYQNPYTYYWGRTTTTVNSVAYTLMTRSGPAVGSSNYLFVFS